MKLQELYEEYDAALRRPGTPLKTFRIKVFVFPACQDVREVCDEEGGDEDALMIESRPDPRWVFLSQCGCSAFSNPGPGPFVG